MAHSQESNGQGIYEPNLTALIDVSLVLVVILLVATPMALQSGIAVSHAGEAGRKAPVSAIARIELVVREDGQVEVNRRIVAREEMGATLTELMPTCPTREVVVRCEDGVPHGTFVGVIDEAKTRGAARIAGVGR